MQTRYSFAVGTNWVLVARIAMTTRRTLLLISTDLNSLAMRDADLVSS